MKTISIGGVTIEQTAALAPMAGVADRAMRQLCREFGACYTVGEMASAKGLCYSDRKTAELLSVTPQEQPMAVQLFGDEPPFLAKAAEIALAYHPDMLDINMGCPAPKIAGAGSGSALMKNPALAGEIVREVVAAVSGSGVPVTVKIRKGWDDDCVTAVEVAQRAEQNGAAAVTVHGRTRKQMYLPPVDRDIIRQVKQAVSIPVIGNGDIETVADAIQMYEETGCDLVMIGRGALGHPWLFKQIRQYFAGETVMADPDIPQRMAIMRRHIEMLCEYKGEYVGMKEARKHTAWYLKGFPGAAALRRYTSELSKLSDIDGLIERVLDYAK